MILALGFLAVASWLSVFLLARLAMVKPHIGALTERAFVALLLSFFGTVCLVLMVNRDMGLAFFPIEVARALFGLCAFGLLLISPIWILLYLTNQLGVRGGPGE